jgi:hypothetical protein
MMRACSLFVVCVLFPGSNGTAQDQAGNAPPSKNLLSDASFENSPPAGLPSGWSYWCSAADGSKYRAEVVVGATPATSASKWRARASAASFLATGSRSDAIIATS